MVTIIHHIIKSDNDDYNNNIEYNINNTDYNIDTTYNITQYSNNNNTEYHRHQI